MKRAAAAVIVVALAIAAAIWFMGRAPERKRPNVLIVTIDTLRADHVPVTAVADREAVGHAHPLQRPEEVEIQAGV